MAFENISKGEFISIEHSTYSCVLSSNKNNKEKSVCKVVNDDDGQFIAYCFNLQQRYDISKLEEFVKLLENINGSLGSPSVEQLLKEIKK